MWSICSNYRMMCLRCSRGRRIKASRLNRRRGIKLISGTCVTSCWCRKGSGQRGWTRWTKLSWSMKLLWASGRKLIYSNRSWKSFAISTGLIALSVRWSWVGIRGSYGGGRARGTGWAGKSKWSGRRWRTWVLWWQGSSGRRRGRGRPWRMTELS